MDRSLASAVLRETREKMASKKVLSSGIVFNDQVDVLADVHATLQELALFSIREESLQKARNLAKRYFSDGRYVGSEQMCEIIMTFYEMHQEYAQTAEIMLQTVLEARLNGPPSSFNVSATRFDIRVGGMLVATAAPEDVDGDPLLLKVQNSLPFVDRIIRIHIPTE